MLDLCKPIQGMSKWLVELDLLVGVIGITGTNNLGHFNMRNGNCE
jgi:hypothetical protein